MQTRSTQRGFTLIECALVCAMVGILASVAVPSYRSQQLRAQRLDAVAALSRLQSAQEQHRTTHGIYASELQALRGVAAVSPQGHYTVALSTQGGESYRATAHAAGAQAQDSRCGAITLEVKLGFAQTGPTSDCWNR
jgi:type IV pilus assembly protein PilE